MAPVWFHSVIPIFAQARTPLASFSPACANMSTVDSAATFKDRYCDDVMQLGAHVKRFEDAGWFTYSDLVFATTFTPNNGEEQRYNEDILVPGLGDPKHADRMKLRRLFFEAYTLVGAQMKRTVEAPTNTPREVPNPELEARRERTESRVDGIELEDETDISDALLTRVITMYEINKLAYIGLEHCTKRGDAMVGINKNEQWESVPNISGGFTIRRGDDGQRADVDGQFALSYALQRRSLSLDMGDVLDFKKHEKLRRKYISSLMSSPPPGFMPIGLAQIVEADKCFWVELGKLTRKGIKRKVDGRPCDNAFDEIMKNFTFNMMLMPRQGVVRAAPTAQIKGAAQAPQQGQPHQGQPKAAKRDAKALAAKEKAAADAIAQAFKKGGKGNGRPGSSREGSKPVRDPRLPAKLIGMCATSSKATGSKRFCFGYNMDSCAGAVPGASCPKGLHACMKPLANGVACSGSHPTFSCEV